MKLNQTDFLRLVIIEKCEVKEGGGPSKLVTFSIRAIRVDISVIVSLAQHFCFSTDIEHKKVASVALMCSTR